MIKMIFMHINTKITKEIELELHQQTRKVKMQKLEIQHHKFILSRKFQL